MSSVSCSNHPAIQLFEPQPVPDLASSGSHHPVLRPSLLMALAFKENAKVEIREIKARVLSHMNEG